MSANYNYEHESDELPEDKKINRKIKQINQMKNKAKKKTFLDSDFNSKEREDLMAEHERKNKLLELRKSLNEK